MRKPSAAGLESILKRAGVRFKRLVTSSYQRKLALEQEYFAKCENVHDLPDIFHYWSNRYVLPKHQPFGITDPEQSFFLYSKRQCEQGAGRTIRIASLGSGNCDVEVRIATRLLDSGVRNFTIRCLDINRTMLERGRNLSSEAGLAQHLEFERGDFNHWRPDSKFDVIIANQALHHVLNLEDLFQTIRTHLDQGGVFLVSDMIGRNGHLRWPEARQAMEPFWAELPSRYKFNRQLNRQEDTFLDNDCSEFGFEGIRAQDILPLLVKNFQFELFVPFANIIQVFVDRSFGHNFDAQSAWDREFIDRVHERDEAGMLNGEWKPCQMLAVLRNEKTETALIHTRLTPEFCIRWPEPSHG